MRILHVVPTYLPATRYGGPIYSVHGLCRALTGRGHEVHVFTTNVDGAGNTDVPLHRPVLLDGVNVWYFPSRRLRRLYWSPSMCQALKNRIGEFDVVHLHSVFLWPTWAAARAARRAGVPYVLSPRGMLVGDLIRRKSRWLKTSWIHLIERRNLRGSAAIHLTSGLERKDLEELGLVLSRIEVIPNGVDVDGMNADRELDIDLEGPLTSGPCALYLGRLSWKKGIDRLIRAWGRVSLGHLIIAGNDDEELAPRLRRLIEDLGLQDRVSLVVRRIGEGEKRTLFSRVSVTVLPSYSENFGNVVLEAMAAGCPVIVTPEVGAAEVVQTAQGGMVVDGDRLSEPLQRLLEDPERAARLGRHGREHVNTHYSWSAVAEKMIGLYRDIS